MNTAAFLFCLYGIKSNTKRKETRETKHIFNRNISASYLFSTFISILLVFVLMKCGFFLFSLLFETTQFSNFDSIRKEKPTAIYSIMIFHSANRPNFIKRCVMCVQWHFEHSIRLCFLISKKKKNVHLHTLATWNEAQQCSSQNMFHALYYNLKYEVL